MSLKRKFKAERAPLVSDTEVRKLKEKFGHTKQSKAIRVSSSVSRKPSSQPFVSAFPYMQCIKSLLATDWAASFFYTKGHMYWRGFNICGSPCCCTTKWVSKDASRHDHCQRPHGTNILLETTWNYGGDASRRRSQEISFLKDAIYCKYSKTLERHLDMG